MQARHWIRQHKFLSTAGAGVALVIGLVIIGKVGGPPPGQQNAVATISSETSAVPQTSTATTSTFTAPPSTPTSTSPPSPPPAPPPRTTQEVPPPAVVDLCGAPANPFGYNFCGRGSVITSPNSNTCTYFRCIANWGNGKGYMIECRDGTFSMSGGRKGSCSTHQGDGRTVSG